MKFPFTYHSKNNGRLVCISLDDHYTIDHIEVWDELQCRWRQITPDNAAYHTYIDDFRSELAAYDSKSI